MRMSSGRGSTRTLRRNRRRSSNRSHGTRLRSPGFWRTTLCCSASVVSQESRRTRLQEQGRRRMAPEHRREAKGGKKRIRRASCALAKVAAQARLSTRMMTMPSWSGGCRIHGGDPSGGRRPGGRGDR